MWCNSLTSINIPNSVTSVGIGCFYQSNNLNEFILNWTDNIIQYNPNGNFAEISANAIFSIPYGTTSLYVAKNYPSDKLVERSE